MAEKRTRRRFTTEFKAQAVKRVLEGGKPLAEVATELGLSTGQLSTWRTEHLAAGSAEALAAVHRSFNKVVLKLWQSSEALRIMMPDLHGQQLVSRAEELVADIAQWDALPGEPRTIACRKRAGNHALRCPLIPINYCQEVGMVDENRVQGGLDKAKGAVKEGVGKLTGDEKMKGEGMADKAKGKAESAVGGAKDAVRDATDKV
jgi:uncharacterized protein YjbJ (UPF0337 family)/transposase-like protein